MLELRPTDYIHVLEHVRRTLAPRHVFICHILEDMFHNAEFTKRQRLAAVNLHYYIGECMGGRLSLERWLSARKGISTTGITIRQRLGYRRRWIDKLLREYRADCK